MSDESKAKTKANADRDRAAGEVFGVWAEAMAQLVSYRHFGTQSVLLDRHHATGTMPMRPDMRASAGMLLAPLAIGMLDAAGNNMDRYYQLGLTQIDIHAFDGAPNCQKRFPISSVCPLPLEWRHCAITKAATEPVIGVRFW